MNSELQQTQRRAGGYGGNAGNHNALNALELTTRNTLPGKQFHHQRPNESYDICLLGLTTVVTKYNSGTVGLIAFPMDVIRTANSESAVYGADKLLPIRHTLKRRWATNPHHLSRSTSMCSKKLTAYCWVHLHPFSYSDKKVNNYNRSPVPRQKFWTRYASTTITLEKEQINTRQSNKLSRT